MSLLGQDGSDQQSASVGTIMKIALTTSRDRFELFLLELEEEKKKYLSLLVWMGVGLFVAMQTLLLTCLVTVYFSPPEYRPAIAIVIVSLHWLLLIGAFIQARHYLKKTETPLESTIDQLKKDMECLKT